MNRPKRYWTCAPVREIVGAWLSHAMTYDQAKAALIDCGLDEEKAVLAMVMAEVTS